MPVQRPPPLILGLHDPLEYREEAVAEAVGHEPPDTACHLIHVYGHSVGAREDAVPIRVKEIRPGELPLRWRNRDEEIREGVQPHLHT